MQSTEKRGYSGHCRRQAPRNGYIWWKAEEWIYLMKNRGMDIHIWWKAEEFHNFEHLMKSFQKSKVQSQSYQSCQSKVNPRLIHGSKTWNHGLILESKSTLSILPIQGQSKVNPRLYNLKVNPAPFAFPRTWVSIPWLISSVHKTCLKCSQYSTPTSLSPPLQCNSTQIHKQKYTKIQKYKYINANTHP